MRKGKSMQQSGRRTKIPGSTGARGFLPIPSALLVVLLVLLSHVGQCEAYSFPFTCNVSTTLAPGLPGSVHDPDAPLCPVCCKQPLNLTFVGTAVARYKKIVNADQCIVLCSANAYYAVTQDHVCECYDVCNETEQATAVGTSLQPLGALGNVTACLSPCFPATTQEPWCNCPLHSSCVPGPRGTGEYRCCCDPTYDHPTLLSDNSTLCLGFDLGSNLFGVQTFDEL